MLTGRRRLNRNDQDLSQAGDFIGFGDLFTRGCISMVRPSRRRCWARFHMATGDLVSEVVMSRSRVGPTEGCMSICRPSSRRCLVTFSMATGAGPTPARRHISPQKAWSPKNGSVIVGHPAARPAPVVPAVSDTCMSAFTQPRMLLLLKLRVRRC